MKKIFTLLFVAIFSVVLVTGCGSKKEEIKEETKTETKEEDNKKDNKKDDVGLITDTLSCKTTEDGKLNQIEVYYSNNKIVKVVETETFEDEEEAKAYVAIFNSLYEGVASAKGNVITAVFTGDSLLDVIGEDEITIPKETLKTELESNGYVCK